MKKATIAPAHPDDRALRVVQRMRPLAVLLQAPTLRPAEVYLLFGIPPSTQRDLVARTTDPMPAPRRLLGRKGHKGVRLFDRAEIDAWWRRQPRTTGSSDAA